MDVKPREVVTYRSGEGKSAFTIWLESLSREFSQAVDARITRIRDGNFGDHKSIGSGVYELRMHKGPGLRLYYGLEGDRVVLLAGGSKKSQIKDIRKAKADWRAYRSEN